MLEKFKALGCLMGLKFHFFNSHLDCFPGHLGAVSEEQGEHFRQDIKEMERRNQGRWTVSMMCDYSWTLHHDIPETSHRRKNDIRSSAGNSKRQYKAIE
jgi:hypothetical protein